MAVGVWEHNFSVEFSGECVRRPRIKLQYVVTERKIICIEELL